MVLTSQAKERIAAIIEEERKKFFNKLPEAERFKLDQIRRFNAYAAQRREVLAQIFDTYFEEKHQEQQTLEKENEQYSFNSTIQSGEEVNFPNAAAAGPTTAFSSAFGGGTITITTSQAPIPSTALFRAFGGRIGGRPVTAASNPISSYYPPQVLTEQEYYSPPARRRLELQNIPGYSKSGQAALSYRNNNQVNASIFPVSLPNEKIGQYQSTNPFLVDLMQLPPRIPPRGPSQERAIRIDSTNPFAADLMQIPPPIPPRRKKNFELPQVNYDFQKLPTHEAGPFGSFAKVEGELKPTDKGVALSAPADRLGSFAARAEEKGAPILSQQLFKALEPKAQVLRGTAKLVNEPILARALKVLDDIQAEAIEDELEIPIDIPDDEEEKRNVTDLLSGYSTEIKEAINNAERCVGALMEEHGKKQENTGSSIVAPLQDIMNQLNTEARIKEAKRTLRAWTMVKNSIDREITQKAQVVHFKQPEANQLNVKLPTIEIEKFSGEEEPSWGIWWPTFEASVHNIVKDYANRFNYLKSFTTGQARRIFSDLDPTQANYEFAIEAMKARYGEDHRLKRRLYTKLENLKPIKGYKSAVDFHIDADRLLRQMDRAGMKPYEDVILLMKLESLLQGHWTWEICRQKRERFETNGKLLKWGPKELLAALDECIKTREEVQDMRGDCNDDKKEEDTAEKDLNSDDESSEEHSDNEDEKFFQNKEELVAFSAVLQSKEKLKPSLSNEGGSSKNTATVNKITTSEAGSSPSRPCGFECGSAINHYNEDCPKYPTAEERKTRLDALKRCQRCFSNKHKTIECRASMRPCNHCGDPNHNRALCPKKFASRAKSEARVVASVLVQGASSEGGSTPDWVEELRHLYDQEPVVMSNAVINEYKRSCFGLEEQEVPLEKIARQQKSSSRHFEKTKDKKGSSKTLNKIDVQKEKINSGKKLQPSLGPMELSEKEKTLSTTTAEPIKNSNQHLPLSLEPLEKNGERTKYGRMEALHGQKKRSCWKRMPDVLEVYRRKL